MTPAERRYQEGLAVASSLRGGNVRSTPAMASTGGDKPAVSTDPWLLLLECSEMNRPPANVAVRRQLEACGVFDLAPDGRDGCRLRLRASGGRLWGWQLRELAALAQAHGGGFTEIGPRGEVEFPLVPWRDAAAALTRARSAGLLGRGAGGSGLLNVVAGPLAGVAEPVDVGWLVAGLDALGTECGEFFAAGGAGARRAVRIGVDGGGRGWPEGVTQDVVLRAVPGGEFRLKLGGGGAAMVDAGVRVPPALALRVGAAAARRWAEGGDWDRGKFARAVEQTLGVRLMRGPAPAENAGERALAPGVYPHPMVESGRSFLVARGPKDGRWRSRALLALAAVAEAEGTGEVRGVLTFSPAGVLVPGVAAGRVETVAEALGKAGFEPSLQEHPRRSTP